MTVYKGREGSAKFGGNNVLELISWDVTMTAQLQDSTVMGDDYTTDEEVHHSWAGSMECFWDPASTGQINGSSPGSRVVVYLYPRGATGFPAVYITGTVTIEEMGLPQAHGDLVKRTIKFKGYGAPTLLGI